jgi:8-oxo-dGTP diphosphatase
MFGLLVLARALPKGAVALVKEAGRHVLRHPVSGVAIVARSHEGRVLLVRRADTLTWTLPGGTLEWGETLRESAMRELREEAGVHVAEFVRVVGVYSAFTRDPRFHAVTVAVEYRTDESPRGPSNPLEILEARWFDRAELPDELAMGLGDALDAALENRPCVFE